MSTDRQRSQMPPRVLPWLYFAVASCSLILAFAAIAWNPRAAAGFFYHARLAGIVHLITVGWLTCSILGALYVVGPLALRTPMPARRSDYAAFASVAIGLVGMVAHFWIEEYGGLAWSGMMVAAGTLFVGSRILRGIRHAPVHGAVKLHLLLAFLNIGAAATMGVLLGFDKVYHFLPGFVLSNVVAHAHFAAIGWVSMMIVGIGYRLLPMVLPAKMPDGRAVYLSAVLLETGAVGLFVTLVLRSAWTAAFAGITAAGFAAFIGHVAVMLTNRRTASPQPASHAVPHALLALGSLAITLALGMWLALAAPSALTMQAALAYGVFGLVGFFSQMVAAMQGRLLPLLAWYTVAHRASDPSSIPPPGRFHLPRSSAVAFVLCVWGVPALAVGFFFSAIPLLTTGALALAAAAALGGIQAAWIALRAFGCGARESPLHAAGRGRPAAQQRAVQAAGR